jgi:hypothetical protein
LLSRLATHHELGSPPSTSFQHETSTVYVGKGHAKREPDRRIADCVHADFQTVPMRLVFRGIDLGGNTDDLRKRTVTLCTVSVGAPSFESELDEVGTVADPFAWRGEAHSIAMDDAG